MLKRVYRRIRPVLCLCCAVIILALLSCPAGAAWGNVVNPLTNARTTRVYLTPSRDSQVIGLLEDGESVHVLGKTHDFYTVNFQGRVCYVPTEQILQTPLMKYYVNCSITSPDTVNLPATNPLDLEVLRQNILDFAYAQLGSACSDSQFDCFDLTSTIFNRNGFSIPRTAEDQMAAGLMISREELQPGDLVFFHHGDSLVSHAGIYIGNGDFIHCGYEGGGCIRSLDSDFYAERFVCARRVLIAGDFPISALFLFPFR